MTKIGTSIAQLFGDCCSGNVFQHDVLMEHTDDVGDLQYHVATQGQHPPSSGAFGNAKDASPISSPALLAHRSSPELGISISPKEAYVPFDDASNVETASRVPRKRSYAMCSEVEEDIPSQDPTKDDVYLELQDSQQSEVSDGRLAIRFAAFDQILDTTRANSRGLAGGLLSTNDHHGQPDPEL